MIILCTFLFIFFFMTIIRINIDEYQISKQYIFSRVFYEVLDITSDRFFYFKCIDLNFTVLLRNNYF